MFSDWFSVSLEGFSVLFWLQTRSSTAWIKQRTKTWLRISNQTCAAVQCNEKIQCKTGCENPLKKIQTFVGKISPDDFVCDASTNLPIIISFGRLNCAKRISGQFVQFSPVSGSSFTIWVKRCQQRGVGLKYQRWVFRTAKLFYVIADKWQIW